MILKTLKFSGGYKQLDILKVVLAVLVLLRHCGQSLFPSSSIFMGVMNVISPVSVPTFFAISGFLFFRKECSNKDLGKYIWRVLKLYSIWTLIFSPIIVRSYYKKKSLNITGLLDFIQKLIFDGAYYHLWFLPSLVFAIAIAFFFAKKLGNRSLIYVAVILYVIGTLVDTYSYISPILEWNDYKNIFLTTRNGLFFGFPFVIIGKYIAENNIKKKTGMLALGFLIMIIEGIYLVFVMDRTIVNMSLSSIILVPAILIFVLQLPTPNVNSVIYRKVSTIIFCVHPITIFFVSRFIKGYIGTMLVLLLTVVFSFILVKISDRIRVLNWLM